MAFDTAQFRIDFPEFSDTVRYPNTQIDFWASIAVIMLIECRWGALYNQGLSLFVAHNITLAAKNAKVASSGGAPGQLQGAQSSKAVGSVSVSYDVASVVETNAGTWNLTTYGAMLYRLSMMIGAGAQQV